MAYPLIMLEVMAEEGDSIAQFRLGYRYEKGIDVDVNYNKAIDWYEKAVQQANTDAMCRLGTLYRDGKGVFPSPQDAIRLFEMAANNGDMNGYYQLGLMYEFGDGVKRDGERAIHYYMLAKDNNKAEYRAGFLFDKGRGIKKSCKDAIEWYLKAATHGNRDAKKNLVSMIIIDKQMLNVSDLVYEWVVEAADSGDVTAERWLGKRHSYGSEHENIFIAAKYYEMAAKNGDAESAFELGLIIERRESTEPSTKALKWFTIAAKDNVTVAWYHIYDIWGRRWKTLDDSQLEQVDISECKHAADDGFWGSYYLLGQLFEKGIGIESDLPSAVYYYKKSAEKGHEGSIVRIVAINYECRIVSDYEIPEEWIQIAADNGCADAQYHMAHKLYSSDLESNRKVAMYYYRSAVKQNHMYSQYELGKILLHDNKHSSDAIKMIGKAAIQGHKDAKKLADDLYSEHLGSVITYDDARTYYLGINNIEMAEKCRKEIESRKNRFSGAGVRIEELGPKYDQ